MLNEFTTYPVSAICLPQRHSLRCCSSVEKGWINYAASVWD